MPTLDPPRHIRNEELYEQNKTNPRTCVYPECLTKLSAYNPNNYCGPCVVKIVEDDPSFDFSPPPRKNVLQITARKDRRRRKGWSYTTGLKNLKEEAGLTLVQLAALTERHGDTISTSRLKNWTNRKFAASPEAAYVLTEVFTEVLGRPVSVDELKGKGVR